MSKREPIRRYRRPRIEIYEPTGNYGYFRIVWWDLDDVRHGPTSAGKTLRAAEKKAEAIASQLLEAGARVSSGASDALVEIEAEQWLVAGNHRTREGRPWTNRHAANMEREWRLRMRPFIGGRTRVDQLADKSVWVRILNEAQAAGLQPASVQKTGQACRSFISWLMDRGLLARNPMVGVSYALTRAHQEGLDPKAVAPDRIPNFDMVFELAAHMAFQAWPARPGRGGHRGRDAVGPAGRAIQPVLVASSGLRNGELFALRASRVDLDALTIRIDQQLVEEEGGQRYIAPPKHASYRSTIFAGFLRDDVADLIAYRRDVSGEDDPVLFPAAGGELEWRSNHTRRFRTAAAKAGWPRRYTWYGLRHLFAVTALDPAGLALPLEEVSKLMGHHSPDFTAKRYLSVRQGWLSRATEAARRFDI